MDVYLMQHGLAVAEQQDPARPLTAEGRAAVERVAARARAAGVRIERCVHSGKLRAEQSAAVLGEALGAAVEARGGLNPGDPPGVAADWLAGEARRRPGASVAIVGHLPHLERLASVLVTGRDDAHPVRFANAALVRLVPDAGYAVAWVLAPELA